MPLEAVFGPEAGRFIQSLHEKNGVVFHLGETVARIDGSQVTLSRGSKVEADLVVAGIGVRPNVALAEQAGLKTANGVLVDPYLETSHPGIYAAGDIACWPDPRSGQNLRIEHWVVAERQGQTAARKILGYREPFDRVPFFWTQQYAVSFNYVGHAKHWDGIDINGSLERQNCAVTYKQNGQVLALLTIGRDLQSLQTETAMETLPEPAARL